MNIQEGSKEAILKTIEKHFDQMNSGNLSIDDLEELVEQTRELYERVLIIRHKAYEEEVFGKAKAIIEESPIITEEIQEKHIEEKEELITPEPLISEEPRLGNLPSLDEEKPIFNLDLFDDEADVKSEIIEESQENHEEIEQILIPENEAESANEVEINQSESEVEIEPIQAEKALESESMSEETPKSINLDEDIFASMLNSDDNSLSSVLMNTHLDTLVGAFGFNEKFQCIKELFNNSSDDFNQAIDVLDNFSSFDEAKEHLKYYVKLNSWDLESEITAEFVRKVYRRYN